MPDRGIPALMSEEECKLETAFENDGDPGQDLEKGKNLRAVCF